MKAGKLVKMREQYVVSAQSTQKIMWKWSSFFLGIIIYDWPNHPIDSNIWMIYLRLFLVFLNAYIRSTYWQQETFFNSVVDGENKTHQKNVGVQLKSGAIMRWTA